MSDEQEFTQQKTDAEMLAKIEDIIDQLQSYNLHDKHRVVSTLYYGLIETARAEGIEFIEIQRK